MVAMRDEVRWQIWGRVFGFEILPPKHELDRRRTAHVALADALWDEEVRPWLPEFSSLFAPSGDPDAVASRLKMLATCGYVLGRDLRRLHDPDEREAHDAGVVSLWLWMASGVMDYLLDEGLPTAELAHRLAPEHLRAALASPGAAEPHHFDRPPCPPQLLFTLRAVERAFDGMRTRLARAAPGPFRDAVHDELMRSVERMVGSELGSPQLTLDADVDLDHVEEELRLVNTLLVWTAAYIGLVPGPRPGDDMLADIRQVATDLGELAWTLDALSDVAIDLEAGVWNRVWLAYAREPASHGAAWRAPTPEGRAAASTGLFRTAVVERLLARVETLLRGLPARLAVPGDRVDRLAGFFRMLAWYFLAPASR